MVQHGDWKEAGLVARSDTFSGTRQWTSQERKDKLTFPNFFLSEPSVTLSKDNCTNRPYMQAHALLWSATLYCDIVAIFSSKCVILLWVCSLTLCLLSSVAGNCLQGHTAHLVVFTALVTSGQQQRTKLNFGCFGPTQAAMSTLFTITCHLCLF